VTPAYEVTYMSTAVGFVQAGLGIAILPATALELGLAKGIVTRPIRGTAVRRPIVIARKAGRSLAPAARVFIEELRAVAG
jgi:LysR family carnitine catabolism transcriptional activator